MSRAPSILSLLAQTCALLLLPTSARAQEDVEIGSYVAGGISSTAPIVFGEEVRVDFIFKSDGFPAVGAYDLLLRWDHDRLRFKGMDFGDGLGLAARGESTSSLVEIGENPFDPFWWATFSQTSFLGIQELSDHQPSIFRGATAIFEVMDPTLSVLGGSVGFGRAASLDNYVRDANGNPLSFNCCNACPLPLAPEFSNGGPFSGAIFATVGQPIQFTVTATDGDSHFLTLSATGTPDGAVHSPYPPPRWNPVTTTFNWVPLRPGVARIEYRVADTDPTTEDDLETVLILVGLTPVAPRIRVGPGAPPALLGPLLPYVFPLGAPFFGRPGTPTWL